MILHDDDHGELNSGMSSGNYVLLGGIAIFSTLGNGFVFWAMFVEKRLRTISNIFILSLAASDFLMGIISLPVYIALHITKRNMLGDAVCSIIACVDNILVIVSMWTLLLTSLDRFILIVYPCHYKELVSKKNCAVSIFAVWLYGISIALLPFFGWNKYGFSGKTCSIIEQDHPYRKGFFFLTFPVPVVVTVSCYVAISVKTYRVHSQVSSMKSSKNNDKVVRMTIMVFCLVLAHIMLTLPAFVVNLISSFDEHLIEENFQGYASDIVLLMFFANAAVNPLLYGIFNTNFQKAARKHCTCTTVDSTPPPSCTKGNSTCAPSFLTMLPRNKSSASLTPFPNKANGSISPAGASAATVNTSDIIIFNPLSTLTRSFSATSI